MSKHLPYNQKDVSLIPQSPCEGARGGDGCAHIIPAAGRWRQDGPWNSIPNLVSLTGELQTNERPCLKGSTIILITVKVIS